MPQQRSRASDCETLWVESVETADLRLGASGGFSTETSTSAAAFQPAGVIIALHPALHHLMGVGICTMFHLIVPTLQA